MDDAGRKFELWYAPTSPFARKVRVAACELGVSHRIDLIRVDPWADDRLRKRNPLAKVPTLIIHDGEILFESSVICDYLDALGPERRLFPPEGTKRWHALRLQGAADGAMTAMGRLFADERKPADERSETMMRRFVQTRQAVLDWLERIEFASDPTISEIAVAVLLGYLEFRWPDRDWQSGRPRLARWFNGFRERPSMQATAHHL